MNGRIKILSHSLWLMAAANCFLAGRLPGQTFNNLHNFTKTSTTVPYFTNSDGANPFSVLTLSGTNLYGTAYSGGTNGDGTVFKIGVNGAGFATMHSFTNSTDGNKPLAGLVLSGTNLYGTTEFGGNSGAGWIFRINTNGSGLTNVYSFTLPSGPGAAPTNADGANPNASLIAAGNFLFGTTEGGGTGGEGVIFRVNLDGTGFTNLHNFPALNGPLLTNSDGASPRCGLILAGATLYGTALEGGIFGSGTIFKLNTNSSGFTNLHSFTVTAGTNFTNADGAYPEAGLMLLNATLYGAAENGAIYGKGNLFSITTNGTGFTNFYNFTGGSDGAYPLGALISYGDSLCGTAEGGGAAGNGTVFQISTNGRTLAVLHSFTATAGSVESNSDGSLPNAGLVLSTNTLYGTTLYGGSAGNGTVFSLAIQPRLNIVASGTNKVVLTWSTNAIGFILQSSTNLFSTNWTNVVPQPTNVNNLFTFTNTISGSKMFFRLIQ